MIKEFAFICAGIAALLLVLGLAGKNDMTAQASAEKHAAGMAQAYALADGDTEFREMKKRLLEMKFSELQRRHREARK